jgi:hypothetical protein
MSLQKLSLPIHIAILDVRILNQYKIVIACHQYLTTIFQIFEAMKSYITDENIIMRNHDGSKWMGPFSEMNQSLISYFSLDQMETLHINNEYGFCETNEETVLLPIYLSLSTDDISNIKILYGQ